MWIYLSWPDLDHNLLLERFNVNVTYKHATKYVLPVILNHCFLEFQQFLSLCKQSQKLLN